MAPLKVVWAVFAFPFFITIHGCGGAEEPVEEAVVEREECNREDGADPCTKGDCCAGCTFRGGDYAPTLAPEESCFWGPMSASEHGQANPQCRLDDGSGEPYGIGHCCPDGGCR
jgi:hypothetical protein